MAGLRSAGARYELSCDEGCVIARLRHDRRLCGAPSRSAKRDSEQGSMAVEAVLLAPVILIFLLFIVGAARIAEAKGEVDGAARDAARAASVQREFGAAQSAANEAASTGLDCQGGPTVSLAGSDWRQGGNVRAEVGCDVDLSSVSGFGFAPSIHLTGTSVVPLEQFRRIE